MGRMNYLKKLFNFLKRNQNEDCLYLNIYAPEAFGRSYSAKMPVRNMIFKIFKIQPLGIIRKIYLVSTSEIKAGKNNLIMKFLEKN